jgi:hypothetical protein
MCGAQYVKIIFFAADWIKLKPRSMHRQSNQCEGLKKQKSKEEGRKELKNKKEQ